MCLNTQLQRKLTIYILWEICDALGYNLYSILLQAVKNIYEIKAAAEGLQLKFYTTVLEKSRLT
jgi:hypothetical protein